MNAFDTVAAPCEPVVDPLRGSVGNGTEHSAFLCVVQDGEVMFNVSDAYVRAIHEFLPTGAAA